MTVYCGLIFDMARQDRQHFPPRRTTAMAVGVEKVRAAKTTRGLFP